MPPRLRLLLCALLLVAPAASARPPRLTLFISVDALGSEMLLRARPLLRAGLAQVLNGGAYYPYARYEYAETVTAVGHATLVTGANPWRHGIVSNRVWNRQTGKSDPILWDADHPALGAPQTPDDVSPLNLAAETLGDRLRLSTAMKGKTVSVSGKARTSVALAGRLGQAWWFNEEVGRFVTGTWHAKEEPAWVKAFQEKRPQDAWEGKPWTLLLPAKAYEGEDDRPFEADAHGMGRTFPHPLGGYKALGSSPMMGELIVQMARAAIDGEGLGRDDVPDMLFVGFSHTDRVYHLYGPYSWEVQDTLLRLDRSIGELIAHAEKVAGGRGNILVVVSADHGGAAIPEHWGALALPAARVDPNALQAGLSAALKERFGADLVVGIEELDVYLDPKVMTQRKLDAAQVRRAAAQWLAAQPQVRLAVPREDLEGHEAHAGFLRSLRLGYYPERSGDVLYLLREYHVLTDEPMGTSHGTPYTYDAMVPLVLFGKGVRPGRYPQEIGVTDVAATVAALLGIIPPAQSEGTVRAEALNLR
jgi:predicted AlkP superfamily pyrophosphatase or phosphodiesterase